MGKKIKIIDLLNKIANGEEVPKKIKYDEKIYEIVNKAYPYMYKDYNGFELEDNMTEYLYIHLNDEVEILDEEDEFEELNKSDYQYSQCPSWNEKEEVIRIMNENFERHQKAIRDIIDNQKKIIERLKNE